MAFTVCTDYPIENVKSYGLNSYLIAFRWRMQKRCPTSTDENHKSKSKLIRKCTPYMDAINRYIFNCKGDNFLVVESLICVLLKTVYKCI